MAVRHGLLYQELVTINGRPYGLTHKRETNERWADAVRESPGKAFIAVIPDGTIISAAKDPTMLQLAGYDIWEIDHEGSEEGLYGRKWDGEKLT